MRILIKNLRFPFSHYRTLNLEPNATSEQIKESYYRLAKESHPDTGNSEQDFVKIKQAYDTLINPASRQLYDKEIFPQKFAQQQKKYSYYGDNDFVDQNVLKQKHFMYTLASIGKGLFVMGIFYIVFSKMENMSDHQIRQQNMFLANENIDSSPGIQEKRRKQYAQEAKQKKFTSNVVDLKVRGGSRQSTRSKEKKKNGICSIIGVQKDQRSNIQIQSEQYF